jgi:hypothetical protein
LANIRKHLKHSGVICQWQNCINNFCSSNSIPYCEFLLV